MYLLSPSHGHGTSASPSAERCADRVQARHPVAVAEHVEGLLAHPGHDAHRRGDVGGVGQLHADVGDRGTERAHRERHHVHGAALHAAGVERCHLLAHLGADRASCCSDRPRPAVAEQMNVRSSTRATSAGIGVGPVAVRALRLVELGERAGVDQRLAEALVLVGGTVAPVDVGGLHDRCPVGDPILESLVAGDVPLIWAPRRVDVRSWVPALDGEAGDGSSEPALSVGAETVRRRKQSRSNRPIPVIARQRSSRTGRERSGLRTSGVPMSTSEPRRRAVARPAASRSKITR